MSPTVLGTYPQVAVAGRGGRPPRDARRQRRGGDPTGVGGTGEAEHRRRGADHPEVTVRAAAGHRRWRGSPSGSTRARRGGPPEVEVERGGVGAQHGTSGAAPLTATISSSGPPRAMPSTETPSRQTYPPSQAAGSCAAEPPQRGRGDVRTPVEPGPPRHPAGQPPRRPPGRAGDLGRRPPCGPWHHTSRCRGGPGNGAPVPDAAVMALGRDSGKGLTRPHPSRMVDNNRWT